MRLAISFGAAMVYDGTMLLLMIIRAIVVCRSGEESDLTRVIYRDGIIYYVYISTLALLNFIILFKLSVCQGSIVCIVMEPSDWRDPPLAEGLCRLALIDGTSPSVCASLSCYPPHTAAWPTDRIYSVLRRLTYPNWAPPIECRNQLGATRTIESRPPVVDYPAL
ncbi:hypothetical protein P691DRAFT_764651 [Macrolepiota fuliginosa MF-IS2]|uniref:Uncharacterized protein n=1 Tax=Macrolepiota fuliginosa MF-IS2 TaxID=1400762 RepID=A0A9P5X442_9AGAR|nr:hypothetical protein P691DRAFT_764651 [Macrolepiota fuliginosa MF-IS2]